jgi:uncharacterized membrane protein
MVRSSSPPPEPARDPEPRWQALIALLAVAGVYVALPSYLTIGPDWLLPGVVLVLVVPLVLLHRAGAHRLDVILGWMITSVMTFGMIVSLVLLVTALPTHKESPSELLVSASALWFTNVLIFALWYWRLDAGGPHRRDARERHAAGAFLFPQMTMLPDVREEAGQRDWSPQFIDYLFLAFNTSTAFSPTDTPVLTRWAKVLMMLQSLISLTILVLLAARAVNIL